jgi:hypothetical protein
MFGLITLPSYGSGEIGRWKPISAGAHASAGLALLVIIGAGILAASAITFLHLRLGIAGHFVIKAALPMLFGFAFVPRRFAGSLMGIVATVTIFAFMRMNVGRLEPGAVAALLSFGPLMDFVTLGKPVAGWKLYLRCALAGLLANLIAFGVKFGAPLLIATSSEFRGGRELSIAMFASFAICGIVAGLISAAICFRHNVKPTANFSTSSESVA